MKKKGLRIFKIKFCLVFLVGLLSLIGTSNLCFSETNVALGKPYTVSPNPNYRFSAPASDRTSLTDGKYSVRPQRFWTQQTTVGWQKSGPVEILIDLGNIFLIKSIVLSTARRKEADVYYPKHIAAFIGHDKNHLRYVGDISKHTDNVPGTYETKRFTLGGIRTKGRYVFLRIYPEGPYIFCDEIEVLEGTQDDGTMGTLTITEAQSIAEQMRRTAIHKELIKTHIHDLKSQIAVRPELRVRLEAAVRQVETADEQSSAMQTLETEILAVRRLILSTQFQDKTFLFDQVSPWTTLTPTRLVSTLLERHPSLTIPIKGYDQAAFVVTNLTSNSHQYTIKLTGGDSNIARVSLYQVPFVESAAIEYVADPIVPLSGTLVLRPGESRMLFLSCLGLKKGLWRGSLEISDGNTVTSIPINSRIVDVVLPDNFSLNSVNWAYLSFNLIRNRTAEAIQDLYTHHTNVVVVPPAYLPLIHNTTSSSFSDLRRYLSLHKGFTKVLLFLNFRSEDRLTSKGKYPFMDDSWKEEFKKWYRGALAAATSAGFSQDQIYLYPFDEMVKKEVDLFIAFARWVRRDIPSARLYATVGRENSEMALPHLDIAQINNKDSVLKKFTSNKAELWLYSGGRPAKSLSPYSFYRLMSWQAFLQGYKGVGFWAYADSGWGDKPGTAWDDFDGRYPDYSVIYEGQNNSIISSRRWEAWRMGIEDYELLSMYAKTKGQKAAYALANDVLKNPHVVTKADEVRRQILFELSGADNPPSIK
jgi:hypothetical protein